MPPGWLAAWQPDQTPPVPADEIAADVARLDAALVPADPRTLAVHAERALSLFPKPDNWATSSGVYFDALADIPEDLIRVAFERVARNCTWWPRPAEVRAQIAAELSERRVAVRRLKVAAAMLRRDAEAAERNRRHRAAMAAAPQRQDRDIAVPVKRLQDLPPCADEIVVTPEEAAAKAAQWAEDLRRSA